MKHIRRFNESKSFSLEDDLYVFFDIDPDVKEETNDLHFFIFDNREVERVKDDKFNPEDLNKYLSSSRFKNFEFLFELTDDGRILILLVTKIFVSQHQNLLLRNLKEEDHPLKIQFDEYRSVSGMSEIYNDAKIYRGLPSHCSLVKGLNYDKSYEFWNHETMDDPMYIDTKTELQYTIFKFI
jgi:hypothetical protein